MGEGGKSGLPKKEREKIGSPQDPLPLLNKFDILQKDTGDPVASSFDDTKMAIRDATGERKPHDLPTTSPIPTAMEEPPFSLIENDREQEYMQPLSMMECKQEQKYMHPTVEGKATPSHPSNK